jgi:hypothetical protein
MNLILSSHPILRPYVEYRKRGIGAAVFRFTVPRSEPAPRDFPWAFFCGALRSDVNDPFICAPIYSSVPP